MKKRILSVFLILALLLPSLAGCTSGGGGPSESPDEQLLETGYYEVYDEDDEFVGYLRVTSSKIVVYDEDANEEDTLRYDYSAKKELYTLDDGELFGSEEFTVEKSKKKLKLITEDGDEYTLEETEKPKPKPKPSDNVNESSDPKPSETMPRPSDDPSPSPTGYVKLPTGCYAAYDGSSLEFYLEVTSSTIIAYDTDGSVDFEASYSYDRDGFCNLSTGGETFPVSFLNEGGTYYMSNGSSTRRLATIRKSDIPTPPSPPPSPSTNYYIGGTGSISLYAWLPDALYYNMDSDYDDGAFMAQSQSYDYSSSTAMLFYAALASGSALQDAVNEARAAYSGSYSSNSDLLFRFFLDNYLYPNIGDFPASINESDLTINGRNWRLCEAAADTGDESVEFVLLFWMEGNDMALVMVAGDMEGNGDFDDVFDTIVDIVYSLELY